MLSVNAIYDGEKIKPLEKFNSKKKYNVIITFVEELNKTDEAKALINFSAQTSGLGFWNADKENIY